MGDESTTNENARSAPDPITVGAVIAGGAVGLVLGGPAVAILGATGGVAVAEGVRRIRAARSSGDNKSSDQ